MRRRAPRHQGRDVFRSEWNHDVRRTLQTLRYRILMQLCMCIVYHTCINFKYVPDFHRISVVNISEGKFASILTGY